MASVKEEAPPTEGAEDTPANPDAPAADAAAPPAPAPAGGSAILNPGQMAPAAPVGISHTQAGLLPPVPMGQLPAAPPMAPMAQPTRPMPPSSVPAPMGGGAPGLLPAAGQADLPMMSSQQGQGRSPSTLRSRNCSAESVS